MLNMMFLSDFKGLAIFLSEYWDGMEWNDIGTDRR